MCCFYVSNTDLHGIQGQKQHQHPKQEVNQHFKLTGVLTLPSHFHRNRPAKKQGKALKSVSFKMFILSCFLLIQMLLPQKQEKQPSQPPGIESYKSQLPIGSAGCQPDAAGENHHSKHWPWPRGTSASEEKTDWEPPYRRGYATLCSVEKSTLKCCGADIDPPGVTGVLPVMPMVFKTHSHTH